MDVTRKLIAHNAALAPSQELGLVYYATAGENAVYAGAAGIPSRLEPTYVQHTFPLRFHLWRELFLEGARCVTPSVRHVRPVPHLEDQAPQPSSYVDRRAGGAPRRPQGDGSLPGQSTATSRRQAERTSCSTGRESVLTPAIEHALGRELTVLTEILRDRGIPFVEDDIQVVDLQNAEEAWLVTTPYCMAPVVRINGVPIGDGAPGRMWRSLLDAWSAAVGKDVFREIVDATE